MSQSTSTNATQEGDKRWQPKKWRPIGMSFLTHLFLVTILILLGYFSSNPSQSDDGILRRVGIVLTVQNDNEETEYLDETDLPSESSDAQALEQQTEPSSTPPPALAAESKQPDRPELPGFESSPDATMDATQMAEVPSTSTSASHYELSAEDLKLIESEQRLLKARAPKGDPVKISVFGSGGMTGRSFVFVIDRSHSMGSQGLGVIAAARKELTGAINQLEPHHMFQIVGYHEHTHTMSSRNLLLATKKNKLAVPDHIGSMSAFGATNHENGMIAALAFKPDVIVLMTDGGFPVLGSGDLKMIKKLAPKGCEIHCIQFGIGPLQITQNFMTRMAEQNEGTFRYIDVTKWDKQN